MSDASQTAPKAAPQIRCPSCAAHVQLPADSCPKCRYDFRTGTKPPSEADEAEGGPLRLWLIGGAVLAAVVVLAVIFLFNSKEEPMAASAPALPPTAASVPDSEIGEALATFDSLTDAPGKISSNPFEELDDGPLMLQPHIILNKSQEVIDNVNDQQKLRDGVLGTKRQPEPSE
ncbi:hypothetical protein C4J81_14325 [Deltaproteobacteria bacterium Smac51]|nr:hypothetical protein C4J81_14325 [Deltaproteobacteria bacterium Smac51]